MHIILSLAYVYVTHAVFESQMTKLCSHLRFRLRSVIANSSVFQSSEMGLPILRLKPLFFSSSDVQVPVFECQTLVFFQSFEIQLSIPETQTPSIL